MKHRYNTILLKLVNIYYIQQSLGIYDYLWQTEGCSPLLQKPKTPTKPVEMTLAIYSQIKCVFDKIVGGESHSAVLMIITMRLSQNRVTQRLMTFDKIAGLLKMFERE